MLTYPDLLIFHSEDRSKNSRRAELGEVVVVINSYHVSRPFRDLSAGYHFAVQ